MWKEFIHCNHDNNAIEPSFFLTKASKGSLLALVQFLLILVKYYIIFIFTQQMKVTKGDKKNTPKNISKNTPKNAPKVIIVYFVKKFHFRIQFCVYSTFYTATVLKNL